jgi:hypothetical protein
MRNNRLVALGLAASVVLVGAPATEAVTFRFEDPHATSPNGTPDACFNGDLCGEELSFTKAGITVTASAFGLANAVIQDLNPGHAGLGAVWHGEHHGHDYYFDPSGDEVDWGEGLLLTFSEPVSLERVHFRDEDHHSHFGPCATFRFSSDGESWDTLDLAGSVGFGPDGPVSANFYFKYGGHSPRDFYLARIRVEPEIEVFEAVPEPGSLLLVGGGLVALWARRRRHA